MSLSRDAIQKLLMREFVVQGGDPRVDESTHVVDGTFQLHGQFDLGRVADAIHAADLKSELAPEAPTVSLDEARAQKKRDAMLWKPLDMLRALIRDVESGAVDTNQMVVHFYEPGTGGMKHHRWSAAGVTFESHLALLTVALNRTLNDWIA